MILILARSRSKASSEEFQDLNIGNQNHMHDKTYSVVLSNKGNMIPNCDLELEHGILNLMHNAPSHTCPLPLNFGEVSLNLISWFFLSTKDIMIYN